MATHFHQLTVKEVRKETADCIAIVFGIPPQLQEIFSFTQGQNVTLKAMIAGEELRRSYSICSSPHDNELIIAIKKVSDGKFSSWAHLHLTKGSLVEVLPPTGKFFTALDAAHKKNYIAFCAGSGITPVLSLIKTTLITEPNSSFTLVYGNKDRASVIFKEQLETLKNKFINRFSVHYILSREKTETPLNEGKIDAVKCDLIFKHLVALASCHEFFLCGPEAMIFCVRDYLLEKGADKKNIHFELFTVPGEKKAAGNSMPLTKQLAIEGKQSSITIKLDGIAFDFNLPYGGEAILDAALRLGADLPFACKGGVCATCRAKLVNGEVYMDKQLCTGTGRNRQWLYTDLPKPSTQ